MVGSRSSVGRRSPGYLKKPGREQKTQALLQAHDLLRNQLQCLIGAGGTGVGQLLGLADIDLDILGLRVLADNHTGVNLLARSDKQGTALLCIEQTVGDGLAAS